MIMSTITVLWFPYMSKRKLAISAGGVFGRLGIWETLSKSSEVKILLALKEERELRYSKLGKLFESRATLDWALRQLITNELIKRTVLTDKKPAQSFYSLTAKGQEASKHIKEILKIVSLDRE